MEHARREGYALLSPARVMITTDEDLAIGEFGISARVVSPDDRAAPSIPPHAARRAARPRSPPPPPVALPSPRQPDRGCRTAGDDDLPARRAARPAGARSSRREAERDRDARDRGPGHEVRGGRAVIGRSRDCDVVLDDANVSRRHCEVVREGDSWFVVDLGSTNGTELNGRAVKRAQLADGDRVAVGSSDVVFGRVMT